MHSLKIPTQAYPGIGNGAHPGSGTAEEGQYPRVWRAIGWVSPRIEQSRTRASWRIGGHVGDTRAAEASSVRYVLDLDFAPIAERALEDFAWNRTRATWRIAGDVDDTRAVDTQRMFFISTSLPSLNGGS